MSRFAVMRVVVVGKGGAGKSFITGSLARLLALRGERVLVLDSDPMPGVGISLGFGPIVDDMLSGAVERDDEDRWHLKRGIGPARAVTRFSKVGPDGVRLLQFGKPGADGMAPIMGSLSGFTQVVRRLGDERVLMGWNLLGDLPAGPRQTAFDWAPYADQAVIVVEPTVQSVLTARRVSRLVSERGRAKPSIVANQVRSSADVEFVASEMGHRPVVAIPYDRAVRAAEAAGEAAVDRCPESEALGAVRHLLGYLDDEARLLTATHPRDTLRARTKSGARP